MAASVSTYENIQVAPFDLLHIYDLRITKTINQHASLFITGVVSEDKKDDYVKTTKSEAQIEVSQGKNKTPVFKGVIVNVEIQAVRGVYYIQIEALSNTYNLDIKLKNHSFQNGGMTYNSLVKKVLSGYSGADFIDSASNGKSIEKFTLQYQETDWEFIKRMASRFNAGLVPDVLSDKPKFFFGVKEGASKGNLEEYDYSVRKKISDFRFSSANHIKGINENDFVYYEVETVEPMEIGSSVTFNNISLFVCESTVFMKDGILTYQHILTPKKGLSQNTIYNEKITGLSLQGKVTEISKDNVKVEFDIDKSNSAEVAWWFNYSASYTAEGNSGWYCMPEKNDNVMVYFPDHKEENGISVGSVRKDTGKSTNNKVDDPEIKYFRTKSGKELMFSKDEIVITAKDGEILAKLNEKDGIEIYSTKQVKIITKDDLLISSGKELVITASDKIDITCKQSNIKMDGVTTIKGNQVKTN